VTSETVCPAPSATADRRRGVLLVLTAGTSSQTGAAVGAHAFDALGPVGVVAIRQVVAASVLLPTVRPPVARFTRAQWWPVLLLGLAFGGMNLALYTAVDRLGLGLAVTLEFLGPLAIALAGSRRLLDLGCAVLAGLGVWLLVMPSASTDVPGVAAGLGAAACWAAYILLNRLVGQRLPGLQATATAAGVSALGYLPVAAVVLLGADTGWQPVVLAAVAGLLSSVVPFALDLTALRLVPTQVFGVLMSAHPVLAALAGLVLLGQVLAVHEVLGILVVVATNAVALSTLRTPGSA